MGFWFWWGLWGFSGLGFLFSFGYFWLVVAKIKISHFAFLFCGLVGISHTVRNILGTQEAEVLKFVFTSELVV